MLVVFGSINLDLVFPVHRLPAVGDTLRQSGGWTEPGGKAVNQSIAAHRDGARVELAGAVGTDAMGEDVLHRLKQQGIGCHHVARLDGSTGRAAIAVADDGHTMILVDPGVNLLARAAQIPERLLRHRTTVLLQMENDPGQIADLIGRARAAGTRIMLNFSPSALIDAEALRWVDILVGNGQELSWLAEHLGCGNSPASIQAALGVTVIGMFGVQGTEAVSADGYWRMEAHPVHMRDTTAAADAFVGVLAGALSRGDNLPVAFRRATVAAGLAVTEVGTGRTMPAKADIDEALRAAPRVVTTEAAMID